MSTAADLNSVCTKAEKAAHLSSNSAAIKVFHQYLLVFFCVCLFDLLLVDLYLSVLSNLLIIYIHIYMYF